MKPLPQTRALLAAAVAALAVALPSTALANPTPRSTSSLSSRSRTTSPPGPTARCGRRTAASAASGASPPRARSLRRSSRRRAGVATGRDGALWVTDRDDSRIERVTTRGEITTYPLPTADAFPTDIVAGPDGALWFTESRGNKIGRITTSGKVTEYPIPTPSAFAARHHRRPRRGDLVHRVGRQQGRPHDHVRRADRVPARDADSLPGPIVGGRDGALYFAEANTNVITRMTTARQGDAPVPAPGRGRRSRPGSLSTPSGSYVAEHSDERHPPAEPVGLVRPRGAHEEQPRRADPRPRRRPLVHGGQREQDRPDRARPLASGAAPAQAGASPSRRLARSGSRAACSRTSSPPSSTARSSSARASRRCRRARASRPGRSWPTGSRGPPPGPPRTAPSPAQGRARGSPSRGSAPPSPTRCTTSPRGAPNDSTVVPGSSATAWRRTSGSGRNT